MLTPLLKAIKSGYPKLIPASIWKEPEKMIESTIEFKKVLQDGAEIASWVPNFMADIGGVKKKCRNFVVFVHSNHMELAF